MMGINRADDDREGLFAPYYYERMPRIPKYPWKLMLWDISWAAFSGIFAIGEIILYHAGREPSWAAVYFWFLFFVFLLYAVYADSMWVRERDAAVKGGAI